MGARNRPRLRNGIEILLRRRGIELSRKEKTPLDDDGDHRRRLSPADKRAVTFQSIMGCAMPDTVVIDRSDPQLSRP
jgi:hypothetical protein